MKLRISDRLLWGIYIAAQIRAYPADRLFTWTPVNYSRKKFRFLVRRLVRENQLQQVLIAGEVCLRLTAKGKDRLMAGYPKLGPAAGRWDGFWRLLIFDIPESDRRRRDCLRRSLNKMGFGRFQDSIYLSAYDWNSRLFPGAVLLEAKQKNLGEPRALAEKIWPIKQLHTAYQQIIDRLSTRFGIKESRRRLDFLKRMHQLYLEILLADPFLPPELLPVDWPGDKCRRFILQAEMVKE